MMVDPAAGGPEGPVRPEYPGSPRPGRPVGPGEPGGPGEAEAPGPDPYTRLFAHRSVWLRTALDHHAANRLAAELMALDVESADPIELVINSPGGPVDAGLSVIDTLDLLRAPVAALCIGQAAGTAAAVLACARATRRATPTARLCLRLRPTEFQGYASQLREQADYLLEQRDQLALRLASATGQLPAVIVMDLDQGGFMTADQAIGYGLIDATAARR
jgi:ATP-dependent Clp protease, protease subunit